MQDIANIVSSIGFPIVFCLLMWKYISGNNKQLIDVITKFTITMAENNRLLMLICNKLDVDASPKEVV